MDTLITTTGSLSGTFNGVPDGTTIPIECSYEGGGGTPPTVKINYTAHTVTATVESAGTSPLYNILSPTVSGTPRQGQTLTEVHGSWSTGPTSYSYQWQCCDSAGNNCTAITGATAQTYTLTAADVGSTIRVQETASNGGGSGEPAVSAATAVVQAPPPPPPRHHHHPGRW